MDASRTSVLRLLLVGLVFHLVYIGTVFDCYFTSPVVHGMKSHGVDSAAAKRLVLIVGDGLRADLLLGLNSFSFIPNAPETVAPYLRSIIETRGAFGISHTHVPTESRPGHVALIGGMYEDVSAVTKGWKTNPVDFDSVFNRSSHTFSFGSPDILPMFARGATPGRVEMWCYDEEDEDFTKDATALDIWVLDQLRSLLHNATSDPQLDARLRADRTVFFLHLLGLDTTGHSYRPHSKEYMNNIQIVDAIVRQTEELFKEFYEDEETSYIFTADHGMSKIGNHGDGDPDNTRTPLITWGAGLRGPLPDSVPSSHDAYSSSWGLSHLLRRDVEQADVAPLMAVLIGAEWPVNSVGVLPDVDPSQPGFLALDQGEEKQAKAALVNAKVILEHFRIKHELKKEHTLYYRPYAPLANDPIPASVELASIEDLIDKARYTEARQASATLIKTALEGLRYLETYDRLLIRTIVCVAYLGWMAFGAVSILLPSQTHAAGSLQTTVHIVTMGVLLALWSSFYLQRSPWSFYVYVCFPCYFWDQVFSRATGPIMHKLQSQGGLHLSTIFSIATRGFIVVLALLSMVLAYTERSIWSVWFAIIGTLWPVFWPRGMLATRQNQILCALWTVACLGTAIFPLLPVDKQETLPEILAGGVSMIAIGVVGALKTAPHEHARRQFRIAVGVQISLILASMVVTASSVKSLQAKLGLPLLNQVTGWIILVVASAFPFVVSTSKSGPAGRILTYFLAFSVCFVILSISVEGLFYVAYSVTLYVWTEVEVAVRRSKIASPPSGTKNMRDGIYRPQADDLRIAVFFLFFVQVGFFGTGNVASISSFYLEPVYRLVPIFNPFLMAVLLMFKILAPYIILSTCFALLHARLHLPPFSLFLIALTLTDVMTMTFFFKVTDTGSWLEIGQTISFFCISSLLLVFSASLCAIGERLMKGAEAELSGTKVE